VILSNLLFIPPTDLGTPPMSESPWSLLPTASNHAASLDALYIFITVVCGVSMALVIGAQIYFMVKYKKRSDNDRTSPLKHSAKLEFAWSALPTVFLVIFFVWGEVDFMKMSVAPTDAMVVNVKAQKWSWEFSYPGGNGATSTEMRKDANGQNVMDASGAPIIVPTLIVPLDQPVKLVMQSPDVIHSFYVPAFRVKKDVVPGRYSTVWFTAIQEGEFPIFCTEYCGDEHSSMLAKVVVVKPEDFKARVAAATKLEKLPDESVAQFGERVYKTKGCDACHSTDGSTKVGPSLKGLWDKTETLSDGSTVKVDHNYIKESINDPNAKIVQGFAPQMPSFAGQLADEDIDALIEFIQGLK
jgi:cytochrome c oxidase subunit 2